MRKAEEIFEDANQKPPIKKIDSNTKYHLTELKIFKKQKELDRINILLKLFTKNQKELKVFIKKVKINSFKDNLISLKNKFSIYLNYLHNKKNILEHKKLSHKNDSYYSYFDRYKDLLDVINIYQLILYEEHNNYTIYVSQSPFSMRIPLFLMNNLTLFELEKHYLAIEDFIILKKNEFSTEIKIIEDKQKEATIIKEKIDEKYSSIIKNIREETTRNLNNIETNKILEYNSFQDVIDLRELEDTHKENTENRKKAIVDFNENIIISELRKNKLKNLL